MQELPDDVFQLTKTIEKVCKDRFVNRILCKQENGTFKENWNQAHIQKQVTKAVFTIQEKVWERHIYISCDMLQELVVHQFKKLTVEYQQNLEIGNWLKFQLG